MPEWPGRFAGPLLIQSIRKIIMFYGLRKQLNGWIKFQVLAVFLLLAHTAQAQLAVPKSVKFDGEQFYQASQQGDGVQKDRVTEYVRKSEDINGQWIKLIAVWEFPNIKDARAYAGNLIKMHKENYPSLGRSIEEKQDGSEVMVSFLSKQDNIGEMNIFRIFKKNGHVVAYQYACRGYGDNARELQAAINREVQLRQAMTLFNPAK